MAGDFLLDMLTQTEKNSTKIDENEVSDNLTFKRDKHGTLWSYNKETGERVGRIYEQGNDDNVAKTFNDLIQ